MLPFFLSEVNNACSERFLWGMDRVSSFDRFPVAMKFNQISCGVETMCFHSMAKTKCVDRDSFLLYIENQLQYARTGTIPTGMLTSIVITDFHWKNINVCGIFCHTFHPLTLSNKWVAVHVQWGLEWSLKLHLGISPETEHSKLSPGVCLEYGPNAISQWFLEQYWLPSGNTQ